MNEVVSALILCLLILFSAYFSATETSFTCLNKVRIKTLVNNGNKKAKLVLKLSDNYDKLITNILIGNNIVNITATTIATFLFISLMNNSDYASTVSTIVMTLAVLTFGEIVPKTLAKKSPEKFAMFSAPLIDFLSKIFFPLSFLFICLQKLLNKLFKDNIENTVTNEELITIIDEEECDGNLDKEDSELIKCAIEFNDVDVEEVLTPRVDIVAISKTANKDEIMSKFKESGFSRLPVFDGNIDNIIGFIHEKDFFYAFLKDDNTDVIKEIMQPIYITTEHTKISELLKKMQSRKTHITVVIDEFGGTSGIVTLEDLIEELVGEIYDESDDDEEKFKEIDNNTYIVNGNAELDKTFELFDKQVNSEIESNSIGGFIVEQFGGIPPKDFILNYEDLKIEILKIEKRRIKSVKITQIKNKNQEE